MHLLSSTYRYSRLILIACLSLISYSAHAQLDLDRSNSITELVEDVLLSKNSGIKVKYIQYKGKPTAICQFKNHGKNGLIKDGIMISTGFTGNAVGPNNVTNKGAGMAAVGDRDLSKIADGPTYDASILQFDLISETEDIYFQYFFASEEYPEYVDRGVNDVFAFLLTDRSTMKQQNLAVLPKSGIPITVNNVNDLRNSEYYISNPMWDDNNIMQWDDNRTAGELSYTFQFDGLTTLLTAHAKVIPGNTYTIKIAISDVGDNLYDSAVFLKSGSFSSQPPPGMEDEMVEVEPTLEERIKNEFEEGEVSVDKEKATISLSLHVPFKHDSYELEDEAMPVLAKVGKLMTELPNQVVTVCGHTDAVGNDEYNQVLSNKRAKTVADYLENIGIPATRISSEGFGATVPVADNDTEEGRAENRRVEFVFRTVETK